MFTAPDAHSAYAETTIYIYIICANVFVLSAYALCAPGVVNMQSFVWKFLAPYEFFLFTPVQKKV